MHYIVFCYRRKVDVVTRDYIVTDTNSYSDDTT